MCLLPESPTEEGVGFAELWIRGYRDCQYENDCVKNLGDAYIDGYATRYEQEQLATEMSKNELS